MLYGLETVSLRKRQESELEVAELKMLSANLHISMFSSTCFLLLLQITMSSANIIVQGDSCLTSSDNWSITIANRKGLRVDP
ncbi:hypothetical protein QTP70_008261 [Hemibagrus guttatus]|uniref:Uncharacterized protein n=1 Tax=Hemibagrus guttatus TaxID=175788 RepID=A0AAE0RHY0_9TELE|nr:hypothetical protein QTP70_008261 [Hemibagrus guttatus]